MITLNNVSAGYATKTGPVVAADDITLQIESNQIVGIAGESGCGKSTLLKLIYGQIGDGVKLFSGSAQWQFVSGETVGPDKIRELWWDKLTYIPQAVNTLNPVRRIEDQLMDSMPARIGHRGKIEIRAELVALFKDLGLEESVFSMFPFQLSGGMMQRVLIAMAAFCEPELILADEPTTALDVVVQKHTLILLHQVQRRLGNALVFVSHDLGVHYQISDRLVICYAGKIVEDGPTSEIFSHPKHPYTRALIDALPRVNDVERRNGLDGRPPNLLSPPQGCRFASRCAIAKEKCSSTMPNMRQIGSIAVACHYPLEAGNE